MNEHPTHDDLLGLAFGLLQDEAMEAVGGHVRACAVCRAVMDRIGTREDEFLDRSGAVADPAVVMGRVGLSWQSPAVPIAILAAGVLCSALPSEPVLGQALVPLVLGAAGVSAWLLKLLLSVETRWRGITQSRFLEQVPASPVERVLFIDGVRLAASQSLYTVRSRIGHVFLFGVISAGVGAVMVAAGYAVEPGVASEAAAHWPALLMAAMAVSLLFGSAMWAAWRLRSLGQTLLDLIGSMEQAVTPGVG